MAFQGRIYSLSRVHEDVIDNSWLTKGLGGGKEYGGGKFETFLCF